MMLKSVLLPMLVASIAFTSSTAAEQSGAEVPKRESAKRACATARGETKTECEKVAKQIDAQRAEPSKATKSEDSQVDSSEDPQGDSQYVQHSSPVMNSASESKRSQSDAKVPKDADPPKEER